MVALPLFKLASLFVRHISKYGANRIKLQAHEHPGFRKFAVRYGQVIHQLNMRLSVALLRNVEAEIRAKEKAAAPTVKTKEETEKELHKEEAVKAKAQAQHVEKQQDRHKDEQHAKGKSKESAQAQAKPTSVWKRKFRPLPEAKAVDLFADVVGDGFILLVAGVLIIYEYQRSSGKPDANVEKIKELNHQLDELRQKEEEREQDDRLRESRILAMESALRNYRDPKTKQPLLPTPTAVAA